MYSCHLFLIPSASVRSLLFLSLSCYLCPRNVPLISPIFFFKKKISSLSHCIVFCCLYCSFKKAFLSLLAILWISAFSWIYLFLSPCLWLLFFTQLFVKPTQTTTLPSCIFFFLWDGFGHCLLECYKPPSLILSGTLSTRSNPLNLLVTSTV